MGCTSLRTTQSSIERNSKRDRFSLEVIPPSQIDYKNDAIASRIQKNPNDLFILTNVKNCFKKDVERIPHKLMQTKPRNVLDSLNCIGESVKNQSTNS